MKPFAEDQEVISKIALSRHVIPPAEKSTGLFCKHVYRPNIFLSCHIPDNLNPLSKNPIKLRFLDPRCYGSTTLYKLIPRITNPTGAPVMSN